MSHDYDFPPEWDAMTPEERVDWFYRERCRRRFVRQESPRRRRVEWRRYPSTWLE